MVNSFLWVVIIAGLTFCCISDGFIFGQMSGMIYALAAPDSPIPLNDDDISWIASTINITCICGYMIVAVLSKVMGRRFSTFVVGAPVLLCWIALYIAQDKYVLLLTRVIVGASFGGVLFQTIVNCGEYLPPSSRQVVCNLITSLGTLSGVMLGHILSLLMDWRKVAIFGLVPSGLACILPLFWIESPSWLASKGKFEECEKAFRALRGPSEENEAEIRNLIAYEKKNQRDFTSRNSSRLSDFKKIVDACKELYFWKIVFMLAVVNIYRAAAGRTLLNTLAITMLQEITGRTDVLLFTLMVDGFGIIGAAFSFYLVHKLKMRQLLFTSGVISNALLICFSASLYFVPNENWYPWIKVILVASYYIVASAGPYPVLDVFMGEVHPLEIKEFSCLLCGSVAGGIHFLAIKLASDMFETLGYSGVFLLNAGIGSLCLAYLWMYMPETKGRTLQEVEVFFKSGKFVDGEKRINAECTREVLISSKRENA